MGFRFRVAFVIWSVVILLSLTFLAVANTSVTNALHLELDGILLFDDFTGQSLDTSVWSVSSYDNQQISVSNSILKIRNAWITSVQSFDVDNHTLEIKAKLENAESGAWGIFPEGDTESGPEFRYYDGKLEACGAVFGLDPQPDDCKVISPFDVTKWHTYTIVMLGSRSWLYVDGELLHKASNWDCQYFWGCYISLYTGGASVLNVDYVRMSTGGISAPEAPTLYPIANSDMDGNYSVSWSDVTGAASYVLEEQKGGGNWNAIHTGSNTSKSRSNQVAGTWCYRVKASNAAGDSGWSNIECTTVDSTPAPPDAPTLYDIENNDGDGNYSICWSEVAESDSYQLQERKDGGSWSSIYEGSSTCRERRNQADGEWCYRVRARNEGGDSAWSETKCTEVVPPACYGLELNVQPLVSGTIDSDPPPNCGDKYVEGTVVTLTAQETSSYRFHSWSGDLSGNSNPTQITMNSDKTVTAEFVPLNDSGDPLFLRQWGLWKINILEAWTQTEGAEDVVIGVIDTGVDYRHIDLGGGKTITARDLDFVNDDNDARDDEGHGTHVAGISAANANDGVGIAGVCPLCRILPIKALDAGGRGFVADIARAIRYAADEGVDVINLSLGSDACADDLADAVNYAYERDVVLVVAAGNACPAAVALGLESFEVKYPAQFERVIAVAATDQNDLRAEFSCYGPAVDISAPGVDILSTYLNGTYKELDGTSMAAPHVAGAAGLLIAQDESHSPAQVQDILQRSSKDIGSRGWDNKTGWGRLDAARALETAGGFAPDAPPARCPPGRQSQIARTQEESLLQMYLRVRDEVFSDSYVGQSYTALYYEYGPTLATILLTDPALLSRTAKFLNNAEEEFESLLPDATGKVTLSQELYDEADALVRDLAAAGDEAFGKTMLETWEGLNLEIYIDEDTNEIWEEVQQLKVYVPLIGK